MDNLSPANDPQDTLWTQYQMFFDKDYDRTLKEGRRTRALFIYGAPIDYEGERYKTEVDK